MKEKKFSMKRLLSLLLALAMVLGMLPSFVTTAKAEHGFTGGVSLDPATGNRMSSYFEVISLPQPDSTGKTTVTVRARLHRKSGYIKDIDATLKASVGSDIQSYTIVDVRSRSLIDYSIDGAATIPTGVTFDSTGNGGDGEFTALFSFTLGLGTHVISCEQTESGASQTKTITVTVEDGGKSMYAVSYNANGSDVANMPNDAMVESGHSYTISTLTPTRSGYTFDGWELNGAAASGSITVDGPKTLYAKWTPTTPVVTTATVKYNVAAAGAYVFPTSETVAVNDTVTLPEAYRDGYTLEGWYDGATKVGEANELYTVAANVTLTAKWTVVPADTYYSVTYQPNAALVYNMPVVNPVSVKSGESYTVAAAPSRDGYTFKGWYDNTEGSGTKITSISAMSADVVLYAIWEEIPAATYTVTFPADGTGYDISQNADISGKLAGDTVNFTVKAGEGYDPATMKVTKTVGMEELPMAAYYMDGSTYYYSLTVEDNTEIKVTAPMKYQYKVTLPSGENFEATFADGTKLDMVEYGKDSQTFTVTATVGSKWKIKGVYANGTKLTANGGSYQVPGVKADTIITVDVEETVFRTVTYVLDGAQMAVQSVESGAAFTALSAPVKEGFIWDSKWYIDGDYTAEYTAWNTDADLVLYGRYAAETYTITYDLNGGEGTAPAATTKTFGQAVQLTDSVPTRTGYTFLGWSKANNATTASYGVGATFSEEISGSLTLYAVWEINTYTVTLPNGTGFTASSTMSPVVEYGDSFTFAVTVDRDYATTAPVVKANTDTLTNPTPVANDDGSKTYTYTISNITADQIVSITVAKNKTYTVTFKTVTDDTPPKIAVYQTQEVEDTYCATQPADPVIKGYTFEGWFKDQACTDGNKYDFAAPVTAATTVYGKMVAIKPVVTIPAAGSVIGADIAFKDTDALAATTETHEHTYKADCTFTVTVQKGYDASAMQVGANGVALAPTDISGDVYTYRVAGVTENTTITVVGIVRKTVIITYMSNARDDVSGMPTQQVVNYYVAALSDNGTITDQKPIRTGYKFLGWAKNSSAAAAEYVAGDTANFTADTTLYAVWEAVKTTITLAVTDCADTANTEEYEDETVTLTATLDKAVSSGSVIFYQNGKVIAQHAANGSDTYTFEAATSEYALDGSAKDVYKVAYKAEGDEGFSDSESTETEIKVLSTAITWELDSSNKMADGANVLMIKDEGGNPVAKMEADTAYTLNLPMVYELGKDALTVDQNYTVKWQYKDANVTWVDYGTTTGNTVSIQPAYSKYSFRALVYPVGAPTSHYTKAYDGESGYVEFLVTEPTEAVIEQEVTVSITASDEISSTAAIDVYQLNEIKLSAVVEPTNADSTKQPSGTVTFYYQVGTGDVIELDSAELQNESGKMTAKITTSDLPVADTTNTKQDVTVIAVYNGDSTFKKSDEYDATAKTLTQTYGSTDADETVTVYSSVIFTDDTVENKAPGASVTGAIKISVSDGKLAANETNVSLQLSDVYTLDYVDGDIAKLTFGTDYTVQWQKLSNAAAYTDFGAADTPWEDISGATGITCAIVVEQGAAYRAVITAQNTPIAKGSYTSVDQDVDGRVTYYSNVLIAGAGTATVTVNVNTSNTSDGYEGIVEGETVTISTFVSGATNTTPISKMTVTVTDNGGSEVFKQEKTDVNGYASFNWEAADPGIYELKVVSESSNGYDPTTITRKLIVRDNKFSFTVSDDTKTYNGKAQGLTAVTSDMCDQFKDLADKCVVVYYYDAEDNQVEPSDAGTYKAVVRLQESAYWTEQVVDTYTFTIEARKVSVVDLVAQAKVYDGTTDANILDIVLGDAAVDTATGLPTGDTGVLNGDSLYAVGTAYTSSTNAGTVTLNVKDVELKGNDAANYVLDGEYAGEDFTIMRNQLKGDIADATYAYGTKKVPADDIIVIDQQGNDFTDYDVTYYYHNGDGVEKVKGLDAKGLYTVIVTPKDTANYKGGAAQKIYVAATAVDAAPVAPVSATIAFSNTVELYGKTTGLVATSSQGNTVTLSAAPTDAGRYIITATDDVTGDKAYGIYTIVKADPELTLTATDADYDSAQQTGSPALTGATADYYSYTGGTIQGVSYTAPTEVGTYVVTAHVNETANYTAHEVSTTFKIKPIELTVKADSWQRHQYGSYPDMTATFSGLATGGAAVDTSKRDVQIQPEFVFDNYTNAGLDQVGQYTVTPVAALARNYTVTYAAGELKVTAPLDPNPELAIHGMISNDDGDKNIAYYGDVIQLYAYGSQKSDIINNSSVLTWTVTGPATIDPQQGILEITGVGSVIVKLQRGEGKQAISTTMTIEAKPQEVMVVVPAVDKVFSGAAQTYGGTVSTLNAMLADPGAVTAVVTGDSRTNIGSQITTYQVSDTNFCSEVYGGLYTINDKDIMVAPLAQETEYGTKEAYENTNGVTGGAYTETLRVGGVAALTGTKTASAADLYDNLDVANKYEILVAGTENINYNVHYKINPSEKVTVKDKPLTVKTGVYADTVGQTAGSLNPAGEYPLSDSDDLEVSSSAAFNQATTRMYGEPNQVMAYILETLVDGDSEADLAALVDWLVTYEFDIAGHASVVYTDKSTQIKTADYDAAYASTIATKGQQIVSAAANIDLINYAESFNLGTQDIYQRPVELESLIDPATSDLYKLVSSDEIKTMLLSNIKVNKLSSGEGGLATLLNHTIADLDLQFAYEVSTDNGSTWTPIASFADLSGYTNLRVTVTVGNPDYYADPLTVDFTVSTTYYKLTFTSKSRSSAAVQLTELNPITGNFDKTKLPTDTVGATSSAVTILIYKSVTGKTSYTDYKDSETPVVEKLMTLSTADGRYTVSYPTLPAASYKLFVIASGYVLIDNT